VKRDPSTLSALDFKALISPTSPAKFFKTHWGRRHLTAKLAPRFRAALAAELCIDDIEKLFSHSKKTMAWFESLEGDYHSMDVPSARNALDLYMAGMTLYLADMATPLIMEWHQRLAAEIGHSGQRITFSVFAARRSGRTRCHYDNLENFTIQLRGSKTWKLAPNRFLPVPLHNWVTGMPPNSEQLRYARGTLPKTIPSMHKKVVLEPGDVLYIPRGYLHEVDASEDSISLFVAFQCHPWASFVTDRLFAHFVQDERWRENAVAEWKGSYQQDGAQARLAILLKQFKEVVAKLKVSDLIDD